MPHLDPIPDNRYSLRVIELCLPYRQHQTVAQQVQDKMMCGYYLRKCSIDISLAGCIMDRVFYKHKLPLQLFRYAPIRSEPWFNNGEYFVGTPPIKISELYDLNVSGWKRSQILDLYLEVSWKELEAALNYMYRLKGYQTASAA